EGGVPLLARPVPAVVGKHGGNRRVQATAREQRDKGRVHLGGVVSANEEPVLAADHLAPKLALADVGVEAGELPRAPIRRGAPDDLTETEARVGELAAAGRTNREITATLFLSAKTVEANLGRIYAKLGIRGRPELGMALRERERGNQAKK